MAHNPRSWADTRRLARSIANALGFTYRELGDVGPQDFSVVVCNAAWIKIVGPRAVGDHAHPRDPRLTGCAWYVVLSDQTPAWTSAYTCHGDPNITVTHYLGEKALTKLAYVNSAFGNIITRLLYAGAYKNTLDRQSSRDACKALRTRIINAGHFDGQQAPKFEDFAGPRTDLADQLEAHGKAIDAWGRRYQHLIAPA